MYQYEVITPQTALSFVVGALRYGQEVKLKTALMATDKGLTNLLNKTVFESLVEKPQEIKTYDDFLDKITVEDRSALIMGIYHNSYGDEYTTETTCPYCGKTNKNLVRLSKYSKASFYNGKPLEFLNIKKELSFNDGNFKITLVPATLRNELSLVDMTQTLDLTVTQTTILLHTKQIEYDNKTFTVENNLIDILATLDLLLPKDVRQIRKTIEEVFEKYKLEVPYKVKCVHCNQEYSRTLDFVGEFFKQVIEA